MSKEISVSPEPGWLPEKPGRKESELLNTERSGHPEASQMQGHCPELVLRYHLRPRLTFLA